MENREWNEKQVPFENQSFWSFFLATNYPNAYLEKDDCTLGEIVQEALPVNLEWVNDFTQYYDGVMDEQDGYVERPTVVKTVLNVNEVLKIEFHPGDTIFFVNETEIGCTGPHFEVAKIPFEQAEKLLLQKNGDVMFQLLLPMIKLKPFERKRLLDVLQQHFLQMGMKKEFLLQAAECLAEGLLEE